MTGKFLLAVLFFLSMVGQIMGQASLSTTSSFTPSFSITPSFSGSASIAPSAPSTTGSNSWSLSTTGSNSWSLSTTGSNSNSNSNSYSNSYSNSISAPIPAAPINITNEYYGCSLRPDHTNHIYYLCVAWADPTGQSVSWIVTITPNPAGNPGPYTVLFPEIYIFNLTANTQYTISVVGVNAFGRQSAALVGTGPLFKTAPTDAKTDPTKDLTNLLCVNTFSNTTLRRVIDCSWNLPSILPFRIDVKARCISTLAKNKVIRRSLNGTKTDVVLPVNRADFTCHIEIFGVYSNHKANGGHGHKFVQNCDSSTGCVKVQ